jgi:hypothetical protein
MNVVEHPSFEIVRTDDVPEYDAACIIACDKCDKCDTNGLNVILHVINVINTADKNLLDMTVLLSENSLGIFPAGLKTCRVFLHNIFCER